MSSVLSASQPLNSNTLANPTTPFYSGVQNAGVSQVVAGNGIVVSPSNGQGVVTVSASSGPAAGVTQIIAGSNVTLSPTTGVGAVTVNASAVAGTANQISANTASGVTTVALLPPSPAPTAGSYTAANITIDALGRVTAATNSSVSSFWAAIGNSSQDGQLFAPNGTYGTGQTNPIPITSNINTTLLANIPAATANISGILNLQLKTYGYTQGGCTPNAVLTGFIVSLVVGTAAQMTQWCPVDPLQVKPAILPFACNIPQLASQNLQVSIQPYCVQGGVPVPYTVFQVATPIAFAVTGFLANYTSATII